MHVKPLIQYSKVFASSSESSFVVIVVVVVVRFLSHRHSCHS